MFVLSRADQAVQNGDRQAREQLAYELGIAFGARLNYLQPPAFARVALLALPEKQPPGSPEIGFLVEFRHYLSRLASDASYDSSRDEAIVQMTELLETHMQQSWISMAYLKFQGPYIRDARARALARRFAAQKKVVL